MPVAVADALAMLLGVYAAAGLAFAVAFVWNGAGRVDPMAGAGSIGFRVVIVPGVVALWPLLLRRWLQARGPRP